MNELYILRLSDVKNGDFISSFLPVVSPARREKTMRLAKNEDRINSLCSELLPRRILLKKNIHSNPAFETAENGKPYISNLENFYFNVSHSAAIVACTVSDNETGIDAQAVKEADYLKLAKRFFTVEEFAQVNNAEDFFSIWSAKEACVKLLGRHVSDFKEFSVSVKDGFSVWDGVKLFFKHYPYPGHSITSASLSQNFAKKPVFFDLNDFNILRQGVKLC